MSKFWKIAGIATLVAVVGAAILGVAVYAQEPTPPSPFGWMGDFFEQIRDAVASKLGVERADLDTAMAEARQEVIEQAIEDGKITQQQADRMLSHQLGDLKHGMTAFGRGRMGYFNGFRGNRMGNMTDILAEHLDMTVDELVGELQAGKTVAEMAEARGVELQTLVDAIVADRAEFLSQAVAEGRMTQEQADGMLSHMEEEIAEHLTEPHPWDTGHSPDGCFGDFEPNAFGPGVMGRGHGRQGHTP